MKAWKIGLIGTVCTVVLNSCGSDPAVVSIGIDSFSKPQVIPVGARVVIVTPGATVDAAAKDVSGKLFIGSKTFDLTGTGNNIVSFTSTSPCRDFGEGIQIFKYQLFKGTVLFKEDQLQVTVNC